MASIRKHGKGYQIRVSCGYDINGKQIIKTKAWTPDSSLTKRQTEKELERISVLFEEQCKSGLYMDSSTRFADFSEVWLKEYAEKHLRATTIFNYGIMLKTVNNSLGHLSLSKIQPHHLLSFYDDLEAHGRQKKSSVIASENFFKVFEASSLSKIELSRLASVSRAVVSSIFALDRISYESAMKVSEALKKPLDGLFCGREGGKALSGKTVLNFHRLISSILERAVKWQIIASNPCERVEPPKADRKEARYLEEEQVIKILECLEKEPLQYRTMFNLFIFSGMRRGELCGLTWADVDFSTGVIDINKSSLYIPSKSIFDDKTKNSNSARTIKISSNVLTLLKEWQKEQALNALLIGTAWKGERGQTGKIFTKWNGTPVHPDYVTKYFKDFIKRNNLPSVTVHSLRHTNASLMIASGVDIRTVSKRLGHAQTSTTTNIYAHALRSADERASEAIEVILTPKKQGQNHA